MARMNAVIVSFDSLATNSIGCYGNEWIETPSWDRLAATGALFDRYFADTIGLQAGMAWANGHHALAPSNPAPVKSLGSSLKSMGIDSNLITAGSLTEWQHSAEFHNVRQVEGNDGAGAKPDEVSFAQVVKAGISTWNEARQPAKRSLLWLHAPGPGIPPEGFQDLYFEDFEERGQQLAELSDEALADHPAVYAGAVSLLDHWLGELINNLEASDAAEPVLLIVTAARGKLWQRPNPSNSDGPNRPQTILGDQLARLPLFLKVWGDERYREMISFRSDRLVQTIDIVPTLLDWFGQTCTTDDPPPAGRSLLQEFAEECPARPFVWFGDGDRYHAVRTPDWLCIHEESMETPSQTSSNGGASSVSLFVKPEDIWDVNNVASQQPEIISELLELIPRRQ